MTRLCAAVVLVFTCSGCFDEGESESGPTEGLGEAVQADLVCAPPSPDATINWYDYQASTNYVKSASPSATYGNGCYDSWVFQVNSPNTVNDDLDAVAAQRFDGGGSA